MKNINIDTIKYFKIFATLTDKELMTIINLSIIQNFKQGDIIINEGEKPEYLYIILQGAVSVRKDMSSKTDKNILKSIKVLSQQEGMITDLERAKICQQHINAEEYTLRMLSTGDTLGEGQFLNMSNSLVTATALQDTQVLSLNFDELFEFNAVSSTNDNCSIMLNQEHIHTKLITNAAHIMNDHLKWGIDTMAQSLQNEVKLNEKNRFIMMFFINILVTLMVYMCTLDIAKKYATMLVSSTVVTSTLLSLVVIQFVYLIRKSHMPLQFFGITLRNWKTIAYDSLKYSLIIVLGLILLKLFIITYITEYRNEPLFNFKNTINSTYWYSTKDYDIVYLAGLYALFAIFQEFLIRGVIQSCLEFFSPAKYNPIMPIILSNMIFAISHLHTSLTFAIAAFPFGLFWGWLYYKSRSLVGVSISHVLIGTFIGDVIGFNFILL